MRKASLMLHHAAENMVTANTAAEDVPTGSVDAEHRRAMAEALEILAAELREKHPGDAVIEGEVVE